MSGAVVAVHGRIIRAFANTNAFSEVEARSIEELGLQHIRRGGMFKRMVQRGNIIETIDERFYMERSLYESQMRRKRIIIPFLGGIAIGLIIATILYLLL